MSCICTLYRKTENHNNKIFFVKDVGLYKGTGDKYLNKQKEINLVLSNMSTMKRRIEKINILGQLKTIQKQEKRRKQNAEDLLNPSKNIDEIKAVPVWFSSAAHQEELEKFGKIHKEAMKKDEEREEGEGPKKVKNKTRTD